MENVKQKRRETQFKLKVRMTFCIGWNDLKHVTCRCLPDVLRWPLGDPACFFKQTLPHRKQKCRPLFSWNRFRRVNVLHLSRWVTKSIFSSCCIKPAHLVQRVPIIVQLLCYLHYVQVQFYLFRDFECVLSYPSCLQKGLEGSTHCGVTYVNLHASMQVKSHAPGCCVAPV